MLMSVRDMDVLRLLCWCQNVRPDDLSSISTETERENLITLGLIKRHQRSDTLLLTNSGRAFLQAALEGDVPNLTLSYHDAAIERRVRLSSLMMTAYHAGINVFTITANSLAEPSTLFITAITRSRGHNPWGSARVGAIAHLGSTYYAVHYIYSGIGRMAVNDELAAFHNHTNFGKDTQRAFLFAGASYADIIEELKVRDEKRDTKLIQYSEAYRGLHYPVHLLSCDETGARQLQIMAVPDYRMKLAKLMLRSAYRPPPEDAPAWDAIYQNRPFVIGADMNLRRIDAAIASAKKRGCLPISLAALDAQGDAVLLRRYKDTGYAVIYKVTESVLTELFGHPPSLYLPPCTQYLTKKGAVVDTLSSIACGYYNNFQIEYKCILVHLKRLIPYAFSFSSKSTETLLSELQKAAKGNAVAQAILRYQQDNSFKCKSDSDQISIQKFFPTCGLMDEYFRWLLL